MESKAELFTVTYRNFAEDVYKKMRNEIFGEDIGQNSWLTADEYRDFFSVLNLTADMKVLEIASGSGGPAVFMVKETGCHVTGIDINEDGIKNAIRISKENDMSDHTKFLTGDASEILRFPDESFDVLISIDSINHLMDRRKALKEFYRVLKKGGKLLYTDPVVVTGFLTNEEISVRSSIGKFLFVPVGQNELLLKNTGFKDIHSKDVTENIASVSGKWYDARKKRKKDLLRIEEENNYEALQSFFKMVNLLTSEKRLSRIMFHATK